MKDISIDKRTEKTAQQKPLINIRGFFVCSAVRFTNIPLNTSSFA